jgi:hypothetical protein
MVVASGATSGHYALVSVVGSVRVRAIDAQVCIVHPRWQDYPEFESDSSAVAFRADSLIDPDSGEYPGFAVRTRCDAGDDPSTFVRVDVTIDERPAAMIKLLSSVLYVGEFGVEYGNERGQLSHADVASGRWPIEIWANAATPVDVDHVIFVLTQTSA